MKMNDISLSIAALQDSAALPSSVEDKAQRKAVVNKVSQQEQICVEEEVQLLVTCAEVPDSICKKEEQVAGYAAASSKEASKQDQIQVAREKARLWMVAQNEKRSSDKTCVVAPTSATSKSTPLLVSKTKNCNSCSNGQCRRRSNQKCPWNLCKKCCGNNANDCPAHST